MEENRSNVFCSLIIIMVMMEGCYCGGNNNKVDSGLGGEDVRGYCGVGYYPSWDSECIGVEGCREIEINKCGCHCKRCYFDKCVEVGCKEPCEVGYNDVEEVRDNEVFEVEEEAWVDGVVRDAEVEDVSELEDVYNPYGPHFKPIPDSKVGTNLRIEGDLVIWTTIGNGEWEGIGFYKSDVCYYSISTSEKKCIGDIIDNGGIWLANLNKNGVICYDTFVRDVTYRNEVKYFEKNSKKINLLYSSKGAANYTINSKYIIYSDFSRENEDKFYSYEIKTGETKELNIKDCKAFHWGSEIASDQYMIYGCDNHNDWNRIYDFELDEEMVFDKPITSNFVFVDDIYNEALCDVMFF